MRYPASEKLEIIRLVERSHLPVRRTLDKLGIPATTFYPGFPIWNPPSPLSVARNRSTCNSPSNDGHLRADPDD